MSNLVFVVFRPKSGEESRVESILQNMVVNTRKEPGCQRYDFFDSNNTGRRLFHLVERYADDAALAAHRAADYYKDYRARIMDLLEGPPEVAILNPLDVRS
jgi:quinol monooxygenase YgiN